MKKILTTLFVLSLMLLPEGRILLPMMSSLEAATYTIAPTAYQTVLDSSGNPVSGSCIWTYTAGTSTPVSTYSDSTGTTNSNPITADSAGRFVAYLAPGSSYKFIYEGACVPPAHGTTIKTVDNISAMGLGSVQANDIGQCEGRITLTSGTAITTADVTAATTIYFTPYKGNVCSTYDPVNGTWTLTTFSEVSLALGTDTASRPYDLFGYSNSGTFTLERLIWTSDTARATAVTLQDGVLVKSGQTSRRYLGTYRTTTVAGQTEDSTTKRYVWNFYNRALRSLVRLETTASWNYTLATPQQANASALNQVDVVVGIAEVLLELNLSVASTNTNINITRGVAISVDSTVTPMAAQIHVGGYSAMSTAATVVFHYATVETYPAIGRHFYAWLEYSAATGATTWYGITSAGAVNEQAGLSGWIQG